MPTNVRLPFCIAFGPEMPGWGSWDWLGADLRDELASNYRTVSFAGSAVPECDVLVLIKHRLPADALEQAAGRAAIVYCPVDGYGSAAEIDADRPFLRKCARIVVHCERLRRYFEPYAPVEYLDHHVKFIADAPVDFRDHGVILWVGARSNLSPLVEWVNVHPLPGELLVLTNPEIPGAILEPQAFGFRPGLPVCIEEWSPERHIHWLSRSRAALDVKGCDFRARHKPPAKAIDFIASGLPLAMNIDSSPVEHLSRMGFEVASVGDPRWLSRSYADETRRFGGALRELLSRRRVGLRWRQLLDGVLAERGKRTARAQTEP